MAEDDGISVVLSLKDEFSSAAENVKKALDGLSEGFENITNYAKLAGGVVVAAMALMAHEVMGLSEQLVHLHEVTGISTDRLQELGLAAQTHGSSLEGMAQGLRRLSMMATQASEGSARATETFRKLGVSVYDANGNLKDTNELFTETANGFAKIENPAQRTALAMQLFGRAGANLLPLLEQGSAGFDKMGQIGRDLGIIIGQDAVVAINTLHNQMSILTETGRSLIADVLVKLKEALPDIINFFFDLVVAVNAGKASLKDLVDDLKFLNDNIMGSVNNFKAFWAIMKGDSSAINQIKTLGDIFAEASAKRAAGHAQNAKDLADETLLIDGFRAKVIGATAAIDEMGKSSKETSKGVQAMVDPMITLMEAQGRAQNSFQLTGDMAAYLKQSLKDAEKALADYILKLPPATLVTDDQRQALHELSNEVLEAKDAEEQYKKGIETTKKAQEEYIKVMKEAEDLGVKNGFALTEDQLQGIAKASIDTGKSVQEMFKELEAAKNSTILGGLDSALTEFGKKAQDFKSSFLGLFNGMESAFSSAFDKMLSGGAKFKDILSGFFDDIKKSFFKMISDMLAKEMMAQIFGLGGGQQSANFTMGGGNSSSPLSGGQLGGMGGGLLGGLGSLLGLGSSGTTVDGAATDGGGILGGSGLGGIGLGIGGMAMGGAIAAQGISKGNVTQSVLGGALGGAALGATVGSIIPGIGTVIGGVVGFIAGGIAGYFSGSSSKAKKKRAAAQAAAAAAALAAYQNSVAEELVKANVRGSFGGGLALPDQVDAISKLFSGDVSASELGQFGGAQAIIAQAQGINSQTAANAANNKTVNIGAPVINVSVGSIGNSYDTQTLAQDLGYHLQNTISAAAAGV